MNTTAPGRMSTAESTYRLLCSRGHVLSNSVCLTSSTTTFSLRVIQSQHWNTLFQPVPCARHKPGGSGTV